MKENTERLKISRDYLATNTSSSQVNEAWSQYDIFSAVKAAGTRFSNKLAPHSHTHPTDGRAAQQNEQQSTQQKTHKTPRVFVCVSFRHIPFNIHRFSAGIYFIAKREHETLFCN